MNLPKYPVCSAFSLVEITLALGIASFSLVSVLGLLPIGLSNARSATNQTAAMNLVTVIAADVRATPAGATQSPRFKIDVSTLNQQQTLYFSDLGTASASLDGDARYKAVIKAVWQPSSNETLTRIKIVWPPQASSQSDSVETVVSLSQN
ncbi:MAG: Verru_Chthon cassette protein B [Chthoniobacteraceae bacterium]